MAALAMIATTVSILAACGSASEVALEGAVEPTPPPAVVATASPEPGAPATVEADQVLTMANALTNAQSDDEASGTLASESVEVVLQRRACESATLFVALERATMLIDEDNETGIGTLVERMRDNAAEAESVSGGEVSEAFGVLVNFVEVAIARSVDAGWPAVLSGDDGDFAAYAAEHEEMADAADQVIAAFVHEACGVSDEALDTRAEAEASLLAVTDGGGEDRETALVYDDERTVRVSIPATWTAYAGYPWVDDLALFASQSPVASSSGLFTTNSVTITIINDGTSVEGALSVIDESTRCTLATSWDYSDGVYDGWLDEYRQCDGSLARAWVVSASTPADPGTVVLVQIRSVSGDDWFVDEILDSFILTAHDEDSGPPVEDGYEVNIDPLYCPALDQVLSGIDQLEHPADYEGPLSEAGDAIRAGVGVASAFDNAGPWPAIESIDMAFAQLDRKFDMYDWSLERIVREPSIEELEAMGDLLGELTNQAVHVDAWFDDECASVVDDSEGLDGCAVTLRDVTIEGAWRDHGCHYGPESLDRFANAVLIGDWTRGEQPEDGLASYRTWIFHGDGRWNMHGYPPVRASGWVEPVTLESGPNVRLSADLYDEDGGYLASVQLTEAGLAETPEVIDVNGELFRIEP